MKERGAAMGYSQVELENKILEMYPEIRQHGIEVGLHFDDDKNSWVVKFKKDHHELETFLEKQDADDCIDGKKCVYLGVKLGDFIDNFEGS
jgi:hypothetical protein